MKTTVWMSTQFSGYHRWKDAPETVAFLRNWHRHVFHVKLGVAVSHGNRHVEFIQLKAAVDSYLARTYAGQSFEYSCEQLAADLLNEFKAEWVEVSEDGENGGRVERQNQDLPALQVRTRCFIGTEAEGPRRGRRLLFVPGCVSPQELRQAICYAGPALDGAYYGAGNIRCFRPDTMNALREHFSDQAITLEVEQLDEATRPFCKSMLVVSMSAVDGQHAWIKTITNGEIVWRRDKQTITTRLDDPLFAEDKEVLP